MQTPQTNRKVGERHRFPERLGARHRFRHLGLPRIYADAGVRRYSFHGLSYEFIAQRLKTIVPILNLDASLQIMTQLRLDHDQLWSNGELS